MINKIMQAVVPEVPRMLDTQEFYVYVPEATNTSAGIASFDNTQFDVNKGEVSVKDGVFVTPEGLATELDKKYDKTGGKIDGYVEVNNSGMGIDFGRVKIYGAKDEAYIDIGSFGTTRNPKLRLTRYGNPSKTSIISFNGETTALNGSPIVTNNELNPVKEKAEANSTEINKIKNNTTVIVNGHGGFAAGIGAVDFDDEVHVDGGGAAIGAYAHEGGGGGAIGNRARVNDCYGGGGGAIGHEAITACGGAVGQNAKAWLGFAGGYDAQCGGSWQSTEGLNCIQLGRGTNLENYTLQVYDHLIMDAGGGLHTYVNNEKKSVAYLENGKIPAEFLPDSVDDIIEGTLQNSTTFVDLDGKTVTPMANKIYFDTTSGETYRWSGSAYIKLHGDAFQLIDIGSVTIDESGEGSINVGAQMDSLFEQVPPIIKVRINGYDTNLYRFDIYAQGAGVAYYTNVMIYNERIYFIRLRADKASKVAQIVSQDRPVLPQLLSIDANKVVTVNNTADGFDYTDTEETVEMPLVEATDLAVETNLDSNSDAAIPTVKAVKDGIKAGVSSIGSVFILRGSKPSKAELPTQNNQIGDVWYVEDESVGYIWIDKAGVPQWEQLGLPLDVSTFATKEELSSGLAGKQPTLIAGDGIKIENNVISVVGGGPVVDKKIYGVDQVGRSDPHNLPRTDDAIGKTFSDPASNNVITSDFDNCFPWSDIKEFTDEQGNVFIEIPKFYGKITANPDGTYKHQISGFKHEGFDTLFRDAQGNEFDYVRVGKYEASGDTAKAFSKSGQTCLVNININDSRTACMANGQGYHQYDFRIHTIIQELFLIEFATTDSQSIFRGYVDGNSAALQTGHCDGIVTGSEVSNTDGKHACVYRGIENPFGNTFNWCDGINFQDTNIWICLNPSQYTSDKFAEPYINAGSRSGTNGFVKVVSPFRMYPLLSYATDSSATADTYYSDEYYTNTGNCVLYVGGFWVTSTRAGLWYVNGYIKSDMKLISTSTRLCYTPLI